MKQKCDKNGCHFQSPDGSCLNSFGCGEFRPTPQMIAEADCNGDCAPCDGKSICFKSRVEFQKIIISVSEMNHFCDRLYNRVQHAEFEWLKRYAEDKPEAWYELISAVDNAMHEVIKENFATAYEAYRVQIEGKFPTYCTEKCSLGKTVAEWLLKENDSALNAALEMQDFVEKCSVILCKYKTEKAAYDAAAGVCGKSDK